MSMREIQVPKYSKQWFLKRQTKRYIVAYIGWFNIPMTLFPMYFYEEYGFVDIRTIASILTAVILCLVWLYSISEDNTYEEYIYNYIKKIKHKQDRRYRKWLM